MRSTKFVIAVLSLGVGSQSIAAALHDTSKLVWHSITFGQSTDVNFATNVLPEKIGMNETRLADGQPVPAAGTSLTTPFTLESRGGKVGNSHDGLTYFYTKLPADVNFRLEADFTLNQIGPENGAKPAGQEGAGLLVRDILGSPREPVTKPGLEELPAASNMVMNSITATGDTPPVVALIARKGVQQPWGNTGISIVRENYHPLTTPAHFSLRLTRTDNGYDVAYAPQGSDHWGSQSVPGADSVTQLDKTGYYVGFFASRNASITVNHAKLMLDEAHTQPSPAYVTPSLKARIEMMSSPVISRRDSVIQLRTNGDGQLQIKQDGKPLLRQTAVRGGEVVTAPFHAQYPVTPLQITFKPDIGKPVKQEFPLKIAQVSNPDVLHVSPQGEAGNDGSAQHPLDFDTAVNLLSPGGTLWLADGEYPASIIPPTASGTEKNRKTLRSQGNNVVFNGLKLNASFWNIQGIAVTQKSFHIAGSYNHIDRVKAHHADDTGIWVASPEGIGRALWASHNLISNSESWGNQDPGHKNADGFAVKMRVGEGNRLVNCYSHDNIDDGFDLFNKIEDGPNGSVTIENGLSVHNGSNGFKLGGEGLPVAHVIRQSVAVENGMDGFSDNFNPGVLRVEGNRAVDNKRYNFLFRSSPYTTAKKQGIFKDNLSLRTTPGKYDDAVTGNVDDSNYFYSGYKTLNRQNKEIQYEDFISLHLPDSVYRLSDGGFNYADFLRKK